MTPGDPTSRTAGALAAPDGPSSAVGGAGGVPLRAGDPGGAGNLKPPWQKGRSGNPRGRPPGRRNNATIVFEKAMAGTGEALLATMIAQGLRGDVEALKWLLNRAYPPARGRRIKLALQINRLEDASSIAVEVLRAVAAGQMAIEDGTDLLRMVRETELICRLCEQEPRNDEIEDLDTNNNIWQDSLDLLMHPPPKS